MQFLLVNAANGQVDQQEFRVIVPDAISIRSPGDALISHNLTFGNQVFPEQVWTAFTSNVDGANVTFLFNRFIHENFGFFRRNARVDLRIVDSDPLANWVVNVPSDQTTGFFNAPDRSVSAESFGSGSAELGLTITFIEFNPFFLAAGRYSMTVVGQITNK